LLEQFLLQPFLLLRLLLLLRLRRRFAFAAASATIAAAAKDMGVEGSMFMDTGEGTAVTQAADVDDNGVMGTVSGVKTAATRVGLSAKSAERLTG
jgi:hypothetical protein